MDVLLIENDTTNSDIIRKELSKLEQNKINIVQEKTLHDAIQTLGKESFELILLNLDLPDSQSLQTYEKVQIKSPFSPIIIIDNDNDDLVSEKYIAIGAHDYFTKNEINSDLFPRIMRHAIQRYQSLKSLRENEQRLRYICNAMNDVLWDWDIETDHFWWGNNYYKVLGYADSDTDLHIDSWYKNIHPDDKEHVINSINAALESREIKWKYEYRHYRKDGSIAHIINRGYIVRDTVSGNAERMIGTMMDITERIQTEKRINDMRTRYQTLLNSSPSITYSLDVNKNYTCTFCSDNLFNQLGYKTEDLIGSAIFWKNNLHPADRLNTVKTWRKQIEETGEGYLEYRFKDKKGDYHWIHDTFRLINDENGKPSELVGSWNDITSFKNLSERLSYNEKHDILTGLYNREEFIKQIELTLSEPDLASKNHTLCYIDLDQFKVVNDVCGYFAGDILIKQVSELLLLNIDSTDTLARLGSDDFGIILWNTTPDTALKKMESVLEEIRKMQFDWQGNHFPIHASIGLVQINSEARDPHTIFNMADEACYLAKEQGRNRIQVYSQDNSLLEYNHQEKQQISIIKDALENDRLILYYQIIRPLHPKGQGLHFEILVRMLDDNDNIIPPVQFLPAAEKYNLITYIDNKIIEKTLQWLADNPEIHDCTDICAINLSGQSMSNLELIDNIQKLLKEYKISPEKICFEVTETSALSSFASSIAFINKLRKLGCQFSLDDFGTGYSSFSYLQSLPTDYLKIDGSFIKNIHHNDVNRAMVKSINELGHVSGKITIAEYVEDDEILKVLDEIGVDFVQGYGIEKPKPISELVVSKKTKKYACS